MRRLIAAVSALPLIAAAGAVLAASPARRPAGQFLDMAPVGVPVVWRGRLVNYVFVTLRLGLRSSADSAKLRDQEPYFRDALVRLAHRRPLNRPGDLTRLDDRLLQATMMAQSALIAGPGVVTSVSIVSEAPQHRTGLPIAAPQDAP